MPSPREKRERARESALDRIERQQQEGRLVVRKMTAEERRFWGPPRELPKVRRRRAVPEDNPDDE